MCVGGGGGGGEGGGERRQYMVPFLIPQRAHKVPFLIIQWALEVPFFYKVTVPFFVPRVNTNLFACYNMHTREPLYSNSAVIMWWLQSTSAQNSVIFWLIFYF